MSQLELVFTLGTVGTVLVWLAIVMLASYFTTRRDNEAIGAYAWHGEAPARTVARMRMDGIDI